MLVSSTPKDERKILTKSNGVIDDFDNTGAPATSVEPSAVCPIMSPRAEETSAVPTELVTHQAKAPFCQQGAGIVGPSGTCYSYDRHGILKCTALIDIAIRTVIPNALRPRLPSFAIYLLLSRYPSERCIYDIMRRVLYCRYLAEEDYSTVGRCHECLINRAGLERKHHLKFFLASRPLEFVAMDFLGPL